MLVPIHNRPEKLIQFHSICEKTQAKSPYKIKCIRYKWLGGKGDVKKIVLTNYLFLTLV